MKYFRNEEALKKWCKKNGFDYYSVFYPMVEKCETLEEVKQCLIWWRERMTETKLKPCPFCDGKAHYYYERGNDSIVCEECGAKLTYFDFGDAHDELVKQWNARPIEEELNKENARLREALELINKNGKEYPFDGCGCAYVSERALDGADCVAEWQEITEKLISEEKEMNVFWKDGEEQ